MKLRLPAEVERRILDTSFVEEFRRAVRSRLVPLTKRSRLLLEFVAEKTGLPRETLELYWDTVYRLLVAVYNGRVKVAAGRPQSVMRYSTVATAVFWAVYEERRSEATRLVYEALEPIVLGDPEKARLLFLPVEPATMEEQARLAVELGRRLGLGERGFKVLVDTLCAVTSLLDSKTAARCKRLVASWWTSRTSVSGIAAVGTESSSSIPVLQRPR